MKRTFDFTLACILALVGLPLALVVAFTLWAWYGSVFYRQQRIGQHARTLTVWHFKTMRDGPETDDDRHRITRLGKALRCTGFDAYPELFLILTGKASLVGPRLISARDHARWQHLPGWAERFTVRPGMTGLAQVRTARDDWAGKLAADLEYVRTNTFRGDLAILALTFMAAAGFRWDGAKQPV